MFPFLKITIQESCRNHFESNHTVLPAPIILPLKGIAKWPNFCIQSQESIILDLARGASPGRWEKKKRCQNVGYSQRKCSHFSEIVSNCSFDTPDRHRNRHPTTMCMLFLGWHYTYQTGNATFGRVPTPTELLFDFSWRTLSVVVVVESGRTQFEKVVSGSKSRPSAGE